MDKRNGHIEKHDHEIIDVKEERVKMTCDDSR